MEQVEKEAGLALDGDQPGATCWFGRNENDREYVWCGPVDEDLASFYDREVGPPYFRVWEVKDAPSTSSGLALGPPSDFGDDPEGQIDALPFYPTRWWRPDGRTLDPATLRPPDAPANR